MDVAPTPAASDFNDVSLAAPLADVVRPAVRLQYLHSYSFFFENPNWLVNWLLTSVCSIIPIVGPIVMAGYQFDLIEAMHRDVKRSGTYPDFDFNRFGEYLSRGIWKFLVGMLTQMLLMPVYVVLYMVSVFSIFGIGAAFSSNSNNSGAAMGIAAAIIVPICMLIVLALVMALRMITMPVVLKASLSGDANGLFDFRFATDFIRRTWREMLLEMVWMFVTTPVIALLGYAMCIFGAIPAFVLVQMADAQTNWQLYEIYLVRGGEPITLKVAKPAPVVMVAVNEPDVYPARAIANDNNVPTTPSTSEFSP